MTKMKKTTSFRGNNETTKYWQELSASKLSYSETELFVEQLDWKIVSEKGDLPMESWIKYYDRLALPVFLQNTNVKMGVYNALKGSVNWVFLERLRSIDAEFLRDTCESFSTIRFAKSNESADNIDECIWKEIVQKNDRLFLDSRNKLLFLSEQFVSMDTIRRVKEDLRRIDWKRISESQRLDLAFVLENLPFIHTRAMEKENAFHLLTEQELGDVRVVISDQVDKLIESGAKHDFRKLIRQYNFTNEFEEKYERYF